MGADTAGRLGAFLFLSCLTELWLNPY